MHPDRALAAFLLFSLICWCTMAWISLSFDFVQCLSAISRRFFLSIGRAWHVRTWCNTFRQAKRCSGGRQEMCPREVEQSYISCHDVMITYSAANHRQGLLHYKHTRLLSGCIILWPCVYVNIRQLKADEGGDVIWGCCENAFALLHLNK